jgi:hypothetical protein
MTACRTDRHRPPSSSVRWPDVCITILLLHRWSLQRGAYAWSAINGPSSGVAD